MILVTGGKGMVGSYLREVYDKKELFLTDLEELNICDQEQVFSVIEKVRPEGVIHLAAETNVDKCEIEVDHAYRVNVLGTYFLALACQKYNLEMTYLSTGGVFDGQKTEPYTEFDIPNPLSVYGQTKLEGENVVKSLLDKFFIIRAGWMIGGGKKDIKFVGKIVQLMREKEELLIVNDKFGTITYAKELVLNMKELLKTKFYGTYHLANERVCSRYDVALEIAKILEKDIKIKPISSAAFPLAAPRARSEAIKNYKLELMGLNKMRPWKEALKDYLKEICS
ncbi:dTDP-4-dehydrorhamnose reductase [bacterium]|nr:dTDP-4-dehydrorhamnose reductase [bacterium]MBU1153073.1 dTDP-4-dehydrorhamnose reductase [bacterium]MBU1782443.1 dTDP-4-dehydrorhamnose reductase [bacterium]